MARDLMWEGGKSINLDEFVIISQTWVIPAHIPNPTDSHFAR
jgi:hypothetical protein